MKQILQDLSNGNTTIIESPAMAVSRNQILINTNTTLISAGTERMLVGFGKASYLQKARQQPEKVKMVIDKIKTNGLIETINTVKSKLAQPLALGYCNVGVIAAIGENVRNFQIGDRVISNGSHADLVKVYEHLCARIPDNVDDESAVFTVVASIGLQGIRLAAPTLGEAVVVTGVGLIGLLTVQLLKAHGCRVLAIDFDENKLALARKFGAQTCNPNTQEDPVATAMAFSRGHGVDAVIITAATQSNDPITQAAQMSRKRGRIVLVGVAGLELNRTDFYEKELSFQVSCSYGPGRYDKDYEERGMDYPIGFVRWTEQRNFVACLDMMSTGVLDVKSLITHNYLFEDAPIAYQTLTTDNSALGIILRYTENIPSRHEKTVQLNPTVKFNATGVIIGCVGAGNYASRILIPAFQTTSAQLHSIVTTGGVNGVIHGKKAGFLNATTDVNAILSDTTINTIIIATRHDSHANFVSQALLAGKNVFVEKPLAIDRKGLAQVEASFHTAIMLEKKPRLMVGFNRRFAPHIHKIKALLDTVHAPKAFIMTMNAGAIPYDHWTQDISIGGGRIVGEACHFVDLMRYLANAAITSVEATSLTDTTTANHTEENAMITLGFSNGSVGTIHYLANGASTFPKERIEVFTAGRILQLDNFRKLTGFGWPGFKTMNLWSQDKGQKACVQNFVASIEQGGNSPIPIEEIFEVARTTLTIAEKLRAK